jgi:hypothetical protein
MKYKNDVWKIGKNDLYKLVHQDGWDVLAVSVLDKFVLHVLEFEKDEAFF